MVVNPDFYDRLHSQDQGYGSSKFDLDALTCKRAFKTWLTRHGRSEVRLLDVGCGKGRFLLDLTKEIHSKADISPKRIVGLDLIKTAPNCFHQISPGVEFVQQSVDGNALPFPDQSFDFVSCNHVLEHIFQTESLLRELRRVLHEDGLCVISVPNVAAWMNRIAFLMGGQPLGSEVGTESVTYGFWPRLMQERLKKFTPSGHIRDFTSRSLRDLAQACGFRHAGWWAQNGGFIFRLNPKLGRNLGILLELATRKH